MAETEMVEEKLLFQRFTDTYPIKRGEVKNPYIPL